MNQLSFVNIVDLHNPSRVKKEADNTIILLSEGDFIQDEFKISRVELRLYNEKVDERLGRYSLITSFVETNRGSVEMIYDEGFRGKDALLRASEFLKSNLGISGLILRSTITLRGSSR